MVAFTYAVVLELLENGGAYIQDVGAFWGQATRTRLAGVTAAVLSIPVTLHLHGDIRAVVYAQLLTGPGLEDAHRRRLVLPLVWSSGRTPKGGRKSALASFAIPDLGLYWQADGADPSAPRLAAEFATVLAEEFPDPAAEVTRHFGADLEMLAKLMQEADYSNAGTTLPVDQGRPHKD
ncbi:MAG: hypothetical protein KGJ56_08430 [Gammaproteobacteria bacterium]|nr:hypothetical protein [Gammaproteobacteria bacterium]